MALAGECDRVALLNHPSSSEDRADSEWREHNTSIRTNYGHACHVCYNIRLVYEQADVGHYYTLTGTRVPAS